MSNEYVRILDDPGHSDNKIVQSDRYEYEYEYEYECVPDTRIPEEGKSVYAPSSSVGCW